ncbi:hypothetical protein FB451DRAFT_710596 [Mycena latifolia]|nr:hypothetical protein FB451DRAFT_710596 [Mycena latifolia]
MSAPTSTREWVFVHKPTGMPILSGPDATFALKTTPLPALQDNQVLVRLRYISNDPAQRGWLTPKGDPARMYVPPVEVGAPMRTNGIIEVIESKASNLQKGDLVNNFGLTWSEYMVIDAAGLEPLPTLDGFSTTHFLGALGGPGLTAYYGLKIIVEAKKEDVVVVSGAAGATGSMVVQIAKKMVGCKRVIGIAGSDAKCEWVKSLGADECLNYKSKSFGEDLKKATEDYVDVFFDNVGGEMLDLMLSRMQRGGRVACCGAISTYNSSEPTVLKNFFEIISLRIQLKGFIVMDFLHKAKESVGEMIQAAKEGKLTIGDEGETVVDTDFEKVPETWMKLFEGGNTGKLVTKLY